MSESKPLLMDFVQRYLVVSDAKCSRHCEDVTKFVPIFQSNTSLVGAYVCPGSYVSRVVYFADRPDPKWFGDFLRGQVGSSRLRSKDIRVATRHGWELGRESENEISKVSPESHVVKQYYWTFYPQNEEETVLGTFHCSTKNGGCGRLFTQPMNSKSKLCPNCSKSS